MRFSADEPEGRRGLKSIRERNLFIRGLAGWIGFRQTSVWYRQGCAACGDDEITLKKMFGFAFNGLLAFSLMPLQFATYSWVCRVLR